VKDLKRLRIVLCGHTHAYGSNGTKLDVCESWSLQSHDNVRDYQDKHGADAWQTAQRRDRQLGNRV
jgi:hypothetical protein